MSILVCIPAFNEEGVIGNLIKKIFSFADSVVVCDDGSSDNTSKEAKKFQKIANNFKFIKFKEDIRKKKDVEKWIKNNNFDLIIHFAAIVPISIVNKNYKLAMDINFKGTKNLIKMIKKYKFNLKWFFYSSTSHVYSYSKRKIKENYKIKPITKYGKTKLMAEN